MRQWNPWAEWWSVVCHPFRYVAYVRLRHQVERAIAPWTGVPVGGRADKPQVYVQINPTKEEWTQRPVA